MKKLLYISIVLVFCSCNGKQVDKEQKARQDSILKAQQDSIQKARRDRIQKEIAMQDSLALIAWGDTRFGMTKQEVMASKAFRGGDKEKVNTTEWDSYAMPFDKRLEFERQNGLRELSKIVANFRENELYEVRLESLCESAVHLNDLTHDCYTLIEKFTKRYGAPNSLKKEVTISDLEDEREINLSDFSIGYNSFKHITVYLCRNYDYEYYYYVSIINFDFPKKKHVPTKEEIEASKKEWELQQEVKNNSF